MHLSFGLIWFSWITFKWKNVSFPYQNDHPVMYTFFKFVIGHLVLLVPHSRVSWQAVIDKDFFFYSAFHIYFLCYVPVVAIHFVDRRHNTCSLCCYCNLFFLAGAVLDDRCSIHLHLNSQAWKQPLSGRTPVGQTKDSGQMLMLGGKRIACLTLSFSI